MRAFFESAFDIGYLISVITIGIIMLIKGKEKQYRLFGLMTVILGAGDAFHLIPRIIALCTTGLENYTAALGIGKLVTSVTMTIFYVLLYHVWQKRYNAGSRAVTVLVYILAVCRIALCLFPQNMWTSADAPLSWGIYRNIPFLLLGLLIIILFFLQSKRHSDKPFKWMWLAVTLSFIFYIPVVLWAHISPMIGMLMIPKTCAYLWAVCMGYRAMKKSA